MDNSMYLILGFMAIMFICYMLQQRSMTKKLGVVASTVDGISLQKEGKRKRNIRRALKTMVKAFKALAKQEPTVFKDAAQLSNFNLIIRDNGILKLLTCDEIIGKELIEAIEDLGIDFVVDKI